MQNLVHSNWIESPDVVSAYQLSLLQWYTDNKRDLPWRSQPSLYKTVVSEFMLQQTRVVTVLPYFENWIKKFPDFESLANAKEDKVLKAWEGLGYYSRARNLHKLSKIAVTWKQFALTSIDSWKKLPGVGPYIAAAVTSISFGLPVAVCDGNVVRVLSRIFAIKEKFKDGGSAQQNIRPLAQMLIDPVHPGDYNQAIMELGATVCHRSNPLCSACPILAHCYAGKRGDWLHFPSISQKPKKTAFVKRYWVENQQSILLHASKKGRLRSVFELPQKLPFNIESHEKRHKALATRKRTIGNTYYTEEIFEVTLNRDLPTILPQGYQWMKWSEMNDFTLSAPHRKWMNELKTY